MINRDYYCMSLLYCHDEVQYVQIVNKSMSMSMSNMNDLEVNTIVT